MAALKNYTRGHESASVAPISGSTTCNLTCCDSRIPNLRGLRYTCTNLPSSISASRPDASNRHTFRQTFQSSDERRNLFRCSSTMSALETNLAHSGMSSAACQHFYRHSQISATGPRTATSNVGSSIRHTWRSYCPRLQTLAAAPVPGAPACLAERATRPVRSARQVEA